MPIRLEEYRVHAIRICAEIKVSGISRLAWRLGLSDAAKGFEVSPRRWAGS